MLTWICISPSRRKRIILLSSDLYLRALLIFPKLLVSQGTLRQSQHNCGHTRREEKELKEAAFIFSW